MLVKSYLHCIYFISAVKAAAYLYISQPRNYDEGRQLCSIFGLDLAKVSSEQDIEDLHSVYSKMSGSDVAWLGLRYTDPLFYWPDGTLVKYSRWNNVSDDEPDFLDVTKCAVVKRSILLWHTRACANPYPVLCGPYPQKEKTEINSMSFTRWRDGEQFTAEPTSVKQETSPRTCANECLILNNCMFLSLEDDTCKMYSDITSLNTKNHNKSTIWRRSTLTLDW